MALESINRSVSPAAQKAAELQLIDKAIADFNDRAAQVARSMNGRYRITELVINPDQVPHPRPMMQRAMMKGAMVADTMAEASITDAQVNVTVSVSGSIEVTQ